MSAEDLATAIELLEDGEVQSAIGNGDLTAFVGLVLSGDEQSLFEAAAVEHLDVVGFGLNTGFLRWGIDGESSDDKHKGGLAASNLSGLSGPGHAAKGPGFPGGLFG